MYVTLMRGTELCNRFNFIAASRINATLITNNSTSVKNDLVDIFMAAGDKSTPSLYFLPFNSGNGLDFLSNNFILIYVYLLRRKFSFI